VNFEMGMLGLLVTAFLLASCSVFVMRSGPRKHSKARTTAADASLRREQEVVIEQAVKWLALNSKRARR
jgi:hypothetical protein